ncbi:MAG TPA: TldD/PmbA family protein [Thermoplasmata archaeon]|nr:TldD/PmbA family protein [Thermoplasmata archaeon]
MESAEADLQAALDTLEAHTGYAEVMAEAIEGRGVRFDKEQIILSPTPNLRGAAFRAWNAGRWEEAACTSLGRAELLACAKSVARRIRSSGPRNPPGESPSGKDSRESPMKRPLSDLSVDDQIELARRIYGWGMQEPGIQNSIVTVGAGQDERLFLSTAGARRRQRITRARAGIAPIAMESGKVDYDFDSVGGTGGLEVLDILTEERVRDVAKASKQLLGASAAPTGRMMVLLDASTSGTFAHESFGHGTEADQFVRDRSYLRPILGSTVGPETLTLVDDGTYPGAWGSMFFDDEGHAAQRNVLVDHGRFVSVLTDRESAAALHVAPSGNTRRADFLHRPFVRMTNTFVEPGDWSFDELLEEAKDGVYLQSCTSGIEDPLGGNMQIKVKKGRKIENGRLGPIFSSMALSGKVLDFLKGIRGVGKADAFEAQPGFCGKGHTDLLPVSSGGSFVLSDAIVGPA